MLATSDFPGLSQWFRTESDLNFKLKKFKLVSLSPPELTKDCVWHTKFIIRQDFHCGSHHQFMALGQPTLDGCDKVFWTVFFV